MCDYCSFVYIYVRINIACAIKFLFFIIYLYLWVLEREGVCWREHAGVGEGGGMQGWAGEGVCEG